MPSSLMWFKFWTFRSDKLEVKPKLNASRSWANFCLPPTITAFISRSLESSVEKLAKRISTVKSSKTSFLKFIFKKEPLELADCRLLSNFLNIRTNRKKLFPKLLRNSKMTAVLKFDRDLSSRKKKNLSATMSSISWKTICKLIRLRSKKAKIKRCWVSIQSRNGELRLEVTWSRRKKFHLKKNKLKRLKLTNTKLTRRSLRVILLLKVILKLFRIWNSQKNKQTH